MHNMKGQAGPPPPPPRDTVRCTFGPGPLGLGVQPSIGRVTAAGYAVSIGRISEPPEVLDGTARPRVGDVVTAVGVRCCNGEGFQTVVEWLKTADRPVIVSFAPPFFKTVATGTLGPTS